MKYSKVFVISALLYSSTTMAMEIRQLQAIHNKDEGEVPAATIDAAVSTAASAQSVDNAATTTPAEANTTPAEAPTANTAASPASTPAAEPATLETINVAGTTVVTDEAAANAVAEPLTPAEATAATTPAATSETPAPSTEAPTPAAATPAAATPSATDQAATTQPSATAPSPGAPIANPGPTTDEVPASTSTQETTTSVVSDEAVKAAAAADGPAVKSGNTIAGDSSNAKNEQASKTTSTVLNKDGSTTTTVTTTVKSAVPKQIEQNNSAETYQIGQAGKAKLSGYNGGDEDDVMEKVLKKFSVQGRDSTNNKTSQLFLAKDKAKRAGEIILEATHKLTQQEVPSWINQYFEESWAKYDQNKEGYIRYEEAPVFMRSLMGVSSKLNHAPGSISDVHSGGNVYKFDKQTEFTPVGHV